MAGGTESPGAHAGAPSARLRARTVLVVEDEVLIRMALADALRRQGFLTIEACNAAEALDVVEAGVMPDVLLTDVVLPGHMDGLRLAALMEHWVPGLTVFVVSGRVLSTDLRLRLNFVPKPFDPGDVAARIARSVPPSA